MVAAVAGAPRAVAGREGGVTPSARRCSERADAMPPAATTTCSAESARRTVATAAQALDRSYAAGQVAGGAASFLVYRRCVVLVCGRAAPRSVLRTFRKMSIDTSMIRDRCAGLLAGALGLTACPVDDRTVSVGDGDGETGGMGGSLASGATGGGDGGQENGGVGSADGIGGFGGSAEPDAGFGQGGRTGQSCGGPPASECAVDSVSTVPFMTSWSSVGRLNFYNGGCDSQGTPDYALVFTAPQAGTFRITSAALVDAVPYSGAGDPSGAPEGPADGDSVMTVVRGGCAGPEAQQLECNDDAAMGTLDSQLDLGLDAGEIITVYLNELTQIGGGTGTVGITLL